MKQSTIASDFEVNNVSDPHIDDTQEALVLLFELLLVEDLNGKYTVFIYSPVSSPSVILRLIPECRCTVRTCQRLRSNKGSVSS